MEKPLQRKKSRKIMGIEDEKKDGKKK